MDRPGAFRAGRALLEANILVLNKDQLGFQLDTGLREQTVLASETGGEQPRVSVVQEQRKPLSSDNETAGSRQLKRCQETTVFRRAKDSSKQRSKIHKYTHSDPKRRPTADRIKNTERLPLAGAAKPIPRKYERFSQN
jgi:hypothetical protein